MGIMIGLVPALLWGILPALLNRFAKSGSFVQMQGIGTGILILSAVVTAALQPPALTAGDWLLCFASGIGWMIGMYGQLIGYRTIGVSRTFPLSTGIQIIGNALLGWLVLGEWQGIGQILPGLLCVAVVMAGILIGNSDDRARMQQNHSRNLPRTDRHLPQSTEKESRAGEEGEEFGSTRLAAEDAAGEKDTSGEWQYTLLVALTSVGYCIYSLLPKMASTSNSFSESLPQSLGIFVAGIVITLLFGRRELFYRHWEQVTRASLVGLVYGLASLVFLVSTQMNGMIRGFLLAQLNMIIATLSGIYILKEPQKTALWKSYVGMACILVGCVAIQFL